MELFCKGTPIDGEDILDFGNYVFSQAHGPIDFHTLLPKLYKDPAKTASEHYLIKSEGKIKAMVCVDPISIEVGGETLSGCGVGTVSVHPYARGKNYMKGIMDKAVKDMQRQKYDFSILGGQRQRYQYFGYDPAYIHFFKQDMAPSVDYNGKVMLEAKDRISLSPNGNGGWFSSLCRAGYLKEMQEKGIEWLSVFSVDNVLQRINDPVYVGAVIASGCDCGGKVVRKVSPEERVGVLCKEDGKPAIVEYYEMTDDMRNLRDENGNLLYNFGVTLNYLFRLKRLEDIRSQKLPIHIVEKKIPCLDENGKEVKPEAPNGYKFEDLVLDMIHMMDSCLPYEVVRENEFAPVKNKEGADSVDTARELLKKNGVQI